MVKRQMADEVVLRGNCLGIWQRKSLASDVVVRTHGQGGRLDHLLREGTWASG